MQDLTLTLTFYRELVAEGRGGPRPWEQLQGQIYLGSVEFIAQHQPDRVIREIPRRQTQAKRPTLREVFQRPGTETQLVNVGLPAVRLSVGGDCRPLGGALCDRQSTAETSRAGQCVIARPDPYS